MSKKYVLIDGNSIGHAANSGTVLTVGTTQVQALYGFLRTIRRITAIYPHYTPVVLWDGASWRKMIYADYKANRDKADTIHEKRMQAAKDSFKQQVPAIKTATTMLGIDQVWAINMEADDLAAIMTDLYVKQGHQVMLLTGDQDWIQLVGPGVTWVDPIHDRKINHTNFVEMTGCRDAKAFVEKKALCGDTGDNVPGVGGVGEKGALQFLEQFGSFTEFSNLALDPAFDLKSLPKKYRDLALDEAKRINFAQNLRLMDLRTSARPAPVNLTVTRGAADQATFLKFCIKAMFKSIYEDFDNWISVFPAFHQQELAA